MSLHTKNIQTGKKEVIEQIDLQLNDWGFSFFVKTELEAFKSAYLYAPKKVSIEYSEGIKMFYVTVYNEDK